MACALTIEADKLICIVDGQISDEHGRGIHFMSAKEANMLIRARIVQSEISANHVKVVGEEDIRYVTNLPIKQDIELGLNGSAILIGLLHLSGTVWVSIMEMVCLTSKGLPLVGRTC